ncbi:hypothetical protein VNO78_10810 [Psophocarpus tetragonolobus]|uniref:Uncharacterized protein n=1 Tax=Psophocarpus tetragonolobus TaxID=3891 RepID=A0AAN9XN30_PSOTE
MLGSVLYTLGFREGMWSMCYLLCDALLLHGSCCERMGRGRRYYGQGHRMLRGRSSSFEGGVGELEDGKVDLDNMKATLAKDTKALTQQEEEVALEQAIVITPGVDFSPANPFKVMRKDALVDEE